MSSEAILTLKDRPATVKLPGGWIVQLSVHDFFYLGQLRNFKRRLKAAHPDAGGCAAKFRVIVIERNRWLKRECEWYADLGLLPPDGNQLAKDRLARNLRLRNQKERLRMTVRCAMCRRTRACSKQDNRQFWCDECAGENL